MWFVYKKKEEKNFHYFSLYEFLVFKVIYITKCPL